MALSNFQYSYNGLTFGAGQDVQILKEEGLRSIPAPRSGDVSRPRQVGSFPGLNYFGERSVTLTLSLTVTVNQPWETALASAISAFQPVTDPTQLQTLSFMYPGWSAPRQVTGRVMRAGFPTDVNYQYHYLHGSLVVQIDCPDPLIYDSTLQTQSMSLPATVSGLTFPVSFPVGFGSSSGGTMSVVNSGNWATSPVFTITGPVTTPKITMPGTGQSMRFNITLGASDVLTVDCGARTISLNGASRLNTLATGSTWLQLQPGSQQLMFSSSDSSPVAGAVSCSYRNAWSWC